MNTYNLHFVVPESERTALRIHFSREGEADRQELERFVSGAFEFTHGAKVTQFMPCLMSLRDEHNRLVAVCGLRSAGDGPLFLEQYLDQPIEARLTARMGYAVYRSEIVEVGNFAVAEAGAARGLVNEIVHQLYTTSKQWAVFTVVPLISNAFSKMGIQAEILGEARKECLPLAEQEKWGTYYDQKPKIMAVQRV